MACGRSFNDVACTSEQKGGASPDVQRCRRFSSCIHNNCGWMEVNTIGSNYTWRGPKWDGRDRVFKKIDRILCKIEWCIHYHKAFAKVLPRIQSKYHPIVLMEGIPTQGMNRLFCFETAWSSHPEFSAFVTSRWNNNTTLTANLTYLVSNLKYWNQEVFGNIFRRKNQLMARIKGIQNSPGYGYSQFLEGLEM